MDTRHRECRNSVGAAACSRLIRLRDPACESVPNRLPASGCCTAQDSHFLEAGMCLSYLLKVHQVSSQRGNRETCKKPLRTGAPTCAHYHRTPNLRFVPNALTRLCLSTSTDPNANFRTRSRIPMVLTVRHLSMLPAKSTEGGSILTSVCTWPLDWYTVHGDACPLPSSRTTRNPT